MTTCEANGDPTSFLPKTLGEVEIAKAAFSLDLKIIEGYQSYSRELLRLSLLAIAGVSAVWLKLYVDVPNQPSHPVAVPHEVGECLILASVMLTLSAGAALVHRYLAADSLAYHLGILRRRVRRSPASESSKSDEELGNVETGRRNRRFRASGWLLLASVIFLALGVVIFGIGLTRLMPSA